jgi:hypothetical protein
MLSACFLPGNYRRRKNKEALAVFTPVKTKISEKGMKAAWTRHSETFSRLLTDARFLQNSKTFLAQLAFWRLCIPVFSGFFDYSVNREFTFLVNEEKMV